MDSILQSLKLRLDISDDSQDALLIDILNSAFIAISDKLYGNFESIDKLPLKYQEVAKNATTIYYNQQGAEGQSSTSSDSISQSFKHSDMYDYINKSMPFKPIV